MKHVLYFFNGSIPSQFFCFLVLASVGSMSAEEDPFETLLEDEKEERADFDLLKHTLFIEAEEMKGVGPKTQKDGWRENWRGLNETSRKACVGDHGTISQSVRIPSKGAYRIWTRYRLVSGKRSPFLVKLSRNGEEVYSHRFYSFRLQSSGMVKELQREHSLWFDIPGMQEGFFSGEDWVWEYHDAELSDGVLNLSVSREPRDGNHPLILDGICITASKSYRPKFSDFHEVWLRYRNIELNPVDAEFSVKVAVQWLRPVIINGKLQIGTTAGMLTADKEEPLRKGGVSGWLEVNQALKYGSAYSTTTFSPYRGIEPTSSVTEIDIAWGQRESQILKTLRMTTDLGGTVGAAMPTERSRKQDDITRGVWPASFLGSFRTFKDLSQERFARIKKLVPEPVGVSKYFNFCTAVMKPGNTYSSSEIYKLELQSVSRMGINTLYGAGRGLADQLGLTDQFPPRYYTAGASPARYWVRRACPNHPDVETLADATMKSRVESLIESTNDPKAGEHVFAMKIGDEIGVTVREEHIDTCSDCQAEFHAYLKAEGFDPESFNRSWSNVRWVARDEAVDPFERTLFYYSERFLSANTAGIHAKLVRGARKHYSDGIHVMYNVNPTPVMGGMSLDWFEMERGHGITSQWMEVIGKPEPGRSTFLADVAWGITSRRNLGIGSYNLYVAPKRSARDTLAFIARGCKSFIYYSYGPRTLGAADNFSESDTSIQAVAEATRPVVAAEDYLHSTTRPDREVVIIYSRTAEILDEDNACVRNRAYNYLALNHAHIPADVISEIDVAEGRLDNYKVAYLSGQHLRRDVAGVVAEWVRNGGHLWGDVGAGMRDEADNRLPVLDEVWGAKQLFVERQYPVNFGYYVAATPDAELNTVNWKDSTRGISGSTPAVLQRAILKAGKGEIIAEFDDGLPAAVSNDYGKGKAMLVGYASGLTYSRFFREARHTYPLKYDAFDRSVVTKFAEQAGIKRPITVSIRGIEAIPLYSDKGLAIALIDNIIQVGPVSMEIELPKAPGEIRTANGNAVKSSYADGVLKLELEFENIEIITIPLN